MALRAPGDLLAPGAERRPLLIALSTNSLTPRQHRARTVRLIGAFALLAPLVTWLATIQPLYAAGVLYVLGFWYFCWKKPQIALMIIFGTMPFQSDLSGGGFAKTSIAEISLILTLPVFYAFCIARKQIPRVGPILFPVTCYFLVCLFSSWVTWRGHDALISMLQMALYFIVVVMVFSQFTPKADQLVKVLYVPVVVGVFLSLAGMATHYGFLGMNKNGIGGSLGVCILVAIDLLMVSRDRRRTVLLTAAILIIAAGLLLSLSRGAWLGSLIGLLVIFTLRREFRMMLRLALIMLPLIAVFWAFLPSDSKEYATGLGRDHYNIEARFKSIDLAKDYFEKSPVYGVGVGLRKEYDATNLVLMTLAETGALGLIGLLAIHGVFFAMIWRTHRKVSVRDPLFSLLTIGGALIADKFMHGLVDHYWSRGSIMAAWASAGMATRVYFLTKQGALPWKERS